ncbi:uncharacterized protein LOC134260748 [Saccostrea cucullata]|uniref:uncharacterized protein LOC134260748 n=1 Tax=Saccostrea cuccullata TaxID=36930 RepID=UPI002ED66288
MEDVIDLLGEIQIKETGKRQVRNECLLKLMSTPVLHRSITVPGEICHISDLSPDQVWISDDRNGNIIKSKDNRTKSTLITKTDSSEPWAPQCIYSSHLNGDLLVGMQSYNSGIIPRYNDFGRLKQTIRHGNKGQKLYSYPHYITENHNRGVIVSDWGFRAVVGTDRGRRHRFSYTGHRSGSGLKPLGICTDALSHILVCDFITDTIHMLDRDGHFLSFILTRHQGINGPLGPSYDDKTHLIWVGLCYGKKRVLTYIYTGTAKQAKHYTVYIVISYFPNRQSIIGKCCQNSVASFSLRNF